MHCVQPILLVGLGGAVGAMLRYCITTYIFSTNFPWQVMVINIMGSLAIGLLIGSFSKQHYMYLLLATGLCGGFTTFSSFSADALLLLQQHAFSKFFLYTLGSFTLGILATYVGVKIMQ